MEYNAFGDTSASMRVDHERMCLECKLEPHMKCLLCLTCFERKEVQIGDTKIQGVNLNGELMKPSGIDALRGQLKANYVLEMPAWQVYAQVKGAYHAGFDLDHT